MPRILEYASSVIDLVADELEVSRELILSKSRTAEVVDARHLASHIASALGYSQKGEDACYIAGEAAEKMYPVASKFLCEHCRNH